MTAPSALEPAGVRAAMAAYRDLLRQHQDGINRLNVYPVPDGDTGTNMARTLDAVVGELDALGDAPAMGEVCKAVSHGSLMGARGNSGVILSQLLRGIADRLATAPGAPGAKDLAAALASASTLARQAVVRPVEGTILSVADAAASAASASAAADGSLVDVVRAARDAAAEALARTPMQLQALADAGVVDAGGAGYLVFFDALAAVLDGRSPSADVPGLDAPAPDGTSWPGRASGAGPGPADRGAQKGGADRAAQKGGAGGAPTGDGQEPPVGALRYEVMYLLDAPDETIAAFKEVWAGIGDSIVVVGGDGIWNCHIHTDDIGAAVEAALDAGRPREIRVTDLLEQVEEERWVREGSGGSVEPEMDTPGGPPPTTAVVAVVTGDGIGRIFRSLGAPRQVRGGQSMNPSTAELVDAVEATGSAQVVLLPNNRNIRPVAEQVDALTTTTVRVVPTGSIVEGFAALLAYDPGAAVEENAAAMAASACRVVSGEVTQAVRDATTDVGPVRQGDWIGMGRDGVLCAAGTLADATCKLLDRLLGDDHELVTLIEGEGASAATTRRVTEWLRETRPEVVAEVHHGGQPLYPYLIGIE